MTSFPACVWWLAWSRRCPHGLPGWRRALSRRRGRSSIRWKRIARAPPSEGTDRSVGVHVGRLRQPVRLGRGRKTCGDPAWQRLPAPGAARTGERPMLDNEPQGGERDGATTPTVDAAESTTPVRRTRAPRRKAAPAAAPAATEPVAEEPAAAAESLPADSEPVAPVKAVRARRKKAVPPAAPAPVEPVLAEPVLAEPVAPVVEVPADAVEEPAVEEE